VTESDRKLPVGQCINLEQTSDVSSFLDDGDRSMKCWLLLQIVVTIYLYKIESLTMYVPRR
jgi:hypothetical protein